MAKGHRSHKESQGNENNRDKAKCLQSYLKEFLFESLPWRRCDPLAR